MMTKSTKRSGNGRSSRRVHGQQLFDDALSVAGALVRSQKAFAAERLQSFAESPREYSQSLEDIPSAQNYVVLAAESVDALADYVVETNLDEMVSDATAFARRQPLATIVMALSLGLVATLAVRNQGLARGRSADRSKRINRAASDTAGARKVRRKRSAGKVSRKSPARANGSAHTTANA